MRLVGGTHHPTRRHPSLRVQVLDYLARHNTLALATADAGGPWAAAVFYVNDGFALYFLSDPLSRHGQSVAQDPRVAAAIHEDYRDWRAIQGVQLEGEVHRLTDEVEEVRARSLYFRKFPFAGALSDPAQALPETVERVRRTRFYRIDPVRLLFIDNSRGFGTREEVPLTEAA